MVMDIAAPEGWKTKTILGLVDNIIDYRGRTPKKLGMSWGGYIPTLSAKNVKMGYIDCEEETHKGSEALYTRWMTNGTPKKDDLVITMEAPLGNVALIPDDRKYILSQRTILLQTKPPKVNNKFLMQLMMSPMFQDLLARNSSGSTATGIQRKKLEKIKIALPEIPEQTAIADALSDVDALIVSLDKLIDKKRDIKKATMQQLLTGKKRLPGFDGEWDVKMLGALVQIVNGGTPTTSVAENWNGGIKWCTPTDITGTAGKYLLKTERTISAEGLANCSAQLLPAGALLLCSRATIGEVKIAVSEICTNQGFKALVCGKDVNNEFLYYLLLTMKPKMVEKAVGSTFLEISKKDIASLEVLLPRLGEQGLDEQAAIAAVLSDMDANIFALEARRDKTRDLKQGMMQELLTGRIRLV